MEKFTIDTSSAEDGYYHYFKKVMAEVNYREGSLLEAGFGKGLTAKTIVRLMKEEHIKKRDIWLFDSFAGFPEPTQFDASPRNPKKANGLFQLSRH